MPPWSSAVPSEAAAPTQRDRYLPGIAEHARAAWQNASGYSEAGPRRGCHRGVKQGIGDGLRSRTDRCRATEVAVAVHALNRMLALERPIAVCIA